MIVKSDVEYLIRHLSRSNVVLFLGAGFSTAAENNRGESLPQSRELAAQLWKHLDYPGDYDGTPLSILYQAALTHPNGTASLFDFLRSRLWVASCPEWYRLIANWFWYRIYSTNVENLLEVVYSKYGGQLRLQTIIAPSEYQDRDAFLRTVQLIKLNGSLDRTDLGLTFAPKEYGRRASEQDVWYDHFVRDFSTSPTLLVGTELDEPLFWQYIAVRQRRIKSTVERRPKSFLVCPRISVAKKQVLSEFNVVPVEATAKEFLEMLSAFPNSVFTREQVLHNVDFSLQPLLELEKAGASPSEVEIAENFFSIFRPVINLEKQVPSRSHFLLGSPPQWDDIYSHLDAHREINSEVQELLRENLRAEASKGSVVIVSGSAGSGKTTISKRISVTAVSEGFTVYFTDGEGARPLPEHVVPYLRSLNRKVVLTFDSSGSDLNLIRELVTKCEPLHFKPVIFITIRTNELAIKRFVLQGIENLTEIRVPDLSDPDINAILLTLEQQGLLGQLRRLQPAERFQLFKEKANKQILVAMREATKGKGFDEIIQEEFSQVQPQNAQLLYLIAAIPSVRHSTIRRGQVIAAMELSPSETSSLIDENLNGILLPIEGDSQRLQIRHPLIAEHVVLNVAPRVILAEAYIRFLQLIAHDLPPKRERKSSRVFRLYRDVINHTELNSVFLQQNDLCRKIYDSIRPHFIDDGHYWLQYGSYELEYGDLDFAENYLLQAEAIMPTHPWVGTTMGYLFMRKAVEAPSLMAAGEMVEQGLSKLRNQILRFGSQDPYPYHVLGSQMLAYIKTWIPSKDKAEQLRQLYSEVSEGCKRHPLDGQLKNLAEDIKRAELLTVTVSPLQPS